MTRRIEEHFADAVIGQVEVSARQQLGVDPAGVVSDGLGNGHEVDVRTR